MAAEMPTPQFNPVEHGLDESFRLTGLADLKG